MLLFVLELSPTNMQLNHWLGQFEDLEYPELLVSPDLEKNEPEILAILQADHELLLEAMEAFRKGSAAVQELSEDSLFAFCRARVADKFDVRFGLDLNDLVSQRVSLRTEDGELIVIENRWGFPDGAAPWLHNHLIDDPRMDRIQHAEVSLPSYQWDQTTTEIGDQSKIYSGKKARETGKWYGLFTHLRGQ